MKGVGGLGWGNFCGGCSKGRTWKATHLDAARAPLLGTARGIEEHVERHVSASKGPSTTTTTKGAHHISPTRLLLASTTH